MAAECAEAHRLGYMSYKTKGRPWFDVREQVRKAAAAVPKTFKIDMDFNDTLRNAVRAIPILLDLEKYPQIDIYESPIPPGEIEGNRAIRDVTRVTTAMHYGNPRPAVVVREGVCDGFVVVVVVGGAARVMARGHFFAQVDMPLWLQLVGTGITAAHSLHFGGVLSHATWPAVNCLQLYTHSMLTRSIVVEKGSVRVPDEPGLGYELDRGVVEKFRVSKPARRPEAPRLLQISWPDGDRMYLGSSGKVNFLLTEGNRGDDSVLQGWRLYPPRAGRRQQGVADDLGEVPGKAVTDEMSHGDEATADTQGLARMLRYSWLGPHDSPSNSHPLRY